MRSAKELGSEVLRDVRSTVTQLRADPLEREALHAVLGRVCERYRNELAMPVQWALEPAEGEPITNTAVARILEECLVNIVKHAHATSVLVRLCVDQKRCFLEVRDDGVGFDREASVTGHGLQIMNERASAANDDLTLDSAAGGGTTVLLRWETR